MKITGFNQITIDDKVHDLSQIRAEIVEQECDRVGNLSITYDGEIFCTHVKYPLAYHLRHCQFEVIDDNTIKLGDAIINIPELINLCYWLDDRLFKGTVKEIKEKVTEYLEKIDPEIISGDIWFDTRRFIPKTNETFSEIKAHFIENEMNNINKCLGG